jgi:hypothetical protein
MHSIWKYGNVAGQSRVCTEFAVSIAYASVTGRNIYTDGNASIIAISQQPLRLPIGKSHVE